MSLLRRLRPRRDPLRELLEQRLRRLREQAAREPYKVGSLDVVALWIALKANEDSRRIPRGAILSAALTFGLLLFMLMLRPATSEVELSGVASGFTFALAEGEEGRLLAPMSLSAMSATGIDRMVVDGHQEIEAPYLVARSESEPQLLSPLHGIEGSRVRVHQSDASNLRLSFEAAEPVELGITDATQVIAGGDVEVSPGAEGDRARSSTLIELFPAAGEPFELAMEMSFDSQEVMLAQEVPIRSLRFVETSVDHERPEWSRTLGTIGEATLRFPDFPAIAEPIGRGARIDLGTLRGTLGYGLTPRGELGFRFHGQVEKAELIPQGTEVSDNLIPSWLEILQKDRQATQIAGAVAALLTAAATLLQLRRLL